MTPTPERTPAGAPAETAPLRQWRHWVVAGLVPAIVHRLGNSQASVLGLVDLLQREPHLGSQHAARIQREAAEGGFTLQLVSLLAKEAPPGAEADLREAVLRAARLLELACERAGCALEAGPPPATVVVPGSLQRLVQIVVGLGFTLLGPVPEPLGDPGAGQCGVSGDGRPGAGPPRLRLSAVGRAPGRAELRLTCNLAAPPAEDPRERSGPAEPPLPLPSLVEGLRGELRPLGGDLRLRDLPGLGVGLCLALPAGAGAGSLPAGPPRRAPAPRARLVALFGERTLGELVKAVLAEEGHSVSLAATPRKALDLLAETPRDLLLLDAGTVDSTELQLLCDAGTPIALVSSGTPPPGPWRAVLRTPFRPAQLTEVVEGCLSC